MKFDVARGPSAPTTRVIAIQMTSDRIDEMRKEAERVRESAMYSAQTQFEYSKSWRRVDRWLGGLASLLAAISAAAGLSEVVSSRLAGVVALTAAGVGAVGASLGAPKAKDRAHSAANALLAVQQDARIFINVDLPSLDEGEARDQLQTLVARLQELNATAEIPSARAWKTAKGNVEAGSQKYEIDSP